MKILYAVSECAPYIKTGGLGDVAGALPSALAKEDGIEVSVFLPYYKHIKDNADIKVEFMKNFNISVAWRTEYAGIFKSISQNKNLTYYFIDNEHYFYRDEIYGHYDDGERFTFFSIAILEAMRQLDLFPDIIHCNDWQTGLIPVLKKALYNGVYDNARTVFTIHNIEYQGKMPNGFMEDVIGIDEYYRNILTYNNCINFMKSAIVMADKITTVSKTYSSEILHAYFAHGLEDILKENKYKLSGIVNGIDTELYNPQNDSFIFSHYSEKDLSGKAENKAELQKMLGLPAIADVPLIAMISRLVSHKGLDLLEYVMAEIMQRNLQFAVIGTGDARYEDMFMFNSYIHSDKMSANITFNPELAHKLYAGADMLLMPSKSEPCGLSQLIAMRYGTVPIVRETGGLVDTVEPLNIETLEGKGFTFKLYNAHDMLGAIDRAVEFYTDRKRWATHAKNLMTHNNSWENSVAEYLNLYNELIR